MRWTPIHMWAGEEKTLTLPHLGRRARGRGGKYQRFVLKTICGKWLTPLWVANDPSGVTCEECLRRMKKKEEKV